MSRFLRSFLVLSTSLKRSGERERDSRRIADRVDVCGTSTCPRSASASTAETATVSRRFSGESERAGGPATFGYEGNESERLGSLRSVYFIAPSQPTGGADREGCFVLSWRAGAPTGGTSRDTAPAASGRR